MTIKVAHHPLPATVYTFTTQQAYWYTVNTQYSCYWSQGLSDPAVHPNMVIWPRNELTVYRAVFVHVWRVVDEYSVYMTNKYKDMYVYSLVELYNKDGSIYCTCLTVLNFNTFYSWGWAFTNTNWSYHHTHMNLLAVILQYTVLKPTLSGTVTYKLSVLWQTLYRQIAKKFCVLSQSWEL